MKLISTSEEMIKHEVEPTKKQLLASVKEAGIELITDGKVVKVEADGVLLDDGRKIDCNVPVWATGAEAQ